MVELASQIGTALDQAVRWLVHALLAMQLGIVLGTTLTALVGTRVARASSAQIKVVDRALIGAAGGAWGAAVAAGLFAYLSQRPEQSSMWLGTAMLALGVGLVEGALLGPLAVSAILFWHEASQERAARAIREGQASAARPRSR